MQKNKNIHVIEDYYITAEEGYYTLSEKYVAVKKKTGEQYDAYRIIGYYYTLEQALTGIIREYERKTIKTQSVRDVNDLIDKLTVLEKTMRENLLARVSEHGEK